MPTIHNPVARGFNPDPSILAVGDNFYLATSTFEFQPAVRIHHSRDLVNWTVIGHALEDLDLQGIPDSGGVWAPSLSYADGKFWLAYSVVRTMDGDDKDIDNYLVTAPSVLGPWSAPVHVGSRGFDFSLFHDADGSHWLVGVRWDQRPEYPSFSGLVVEEYLEAEQRAQGTAHLLLQDKGLIEGPNLYQIDGWYYLLIAAGGTGWNHSITLARSRSLLGPYERDPQEAVLTTRDAPGLALQKVGHGELVQTPTGQWILAHLATRPTLHLGDRFGTLGRETCLQPVHFDEQGWLRLDQGGHHPVTQFELEPWSTGGNEQVRDRGTWQEDFAADQLDTTRWSHLRKPKADFVDLAARPGWLRIAGGHSPASHFAQSMVVTRVEEHVSTFEATVSANPRTIREIAGPLAWYDRSGWIWAQITWDQENGRHLRIVQRDNLTTTRSGAVALPDGDTTVRFRLDHSELFVDLALEDGTYRTLGDSLPAWKLSDDYGPRLRFTGMFFGIRVDDLDQRGWAADFTNVRLTSTRP